MHSQRFTANSVYTVGVLTQSGNEDDGRPPEHFAQRHCHVGQ